MYDKTQLENSVGLEGAVLPAAAVAHCARVAKRSDECRNYLQHVWLERIDSGEGKSEFWMVSTDGWVLAAYCWHLDGDEIVEAPYVYRKGERGELDTKLEIPSFEVGTKVCLRCDSGLGRTLQAVGMAAKECITFSADGRTARVWAYAGTDKEDVVKTGLNAMFVSYKRLLNSVTLPLHPDALIDAKLLADAHPVPGGVGVPVKLESGCEVAEKPLNGPISVLPNRVNRKANHFLFMPRKH